jgi:acyl-homoserine lactone acylase PvdQ
MARAGNVTVVRDDWGVPHIYASRPVDAFYGVGYAMSEDNLTNILRSYLGILARIASVEGPRAIELDLESRRWRYAENGRASFDRLPGEMQDWYRAYIRGVRDFMDRHPERVPKWAPSLEPWMPLAISEAINDALSVIPQGVADCRRGGASISVPNLGLAASSMAAPFPETMVASNQWAFAPTRTAINQAILIADSHPTLDSGRIEVRIHTRGLNTSGVVTAGSIIPVIAQTAGVAWSFTDGGPDTADCYEVTVESDDPLTYLRDGQKTKITQEEITIDVAGAKTVTRTLEYTDHNGIPSPVVARAGNKAYVVSSAYWDKADLLERQLHSMNRALSIEEFKEAISIMGLFPINVAAADRKGNIYYVSAGRVPIRDPKIDWRKPVSGNTVAHFWSGIHTLDDLVSIENPSSGVILNMNTAPDTAAPGSAIDATRYPAYIFNDQPGRTNDRYDRGLKLIINGQKLGPEELWTNVATDEVWGHTAQWQRALRTAIDAHEGVVSGWNDGARKVLERIDQFDGFAHKGSESAATYFIWHAQIGQLAASQSVDTRELERTIRAGNLLDGAQSTLMLQAIPSATDRLLALPRGLESTLGDIVRIGRGSPDLPVGGVSLVTGRAGEPTVRQEDCIWSSDSTSCSIVSGSGHPIVTAFTNPLSSFSLLPYGQSQVPGSRHYSDQSRLFSERKLKSTYFNWSDLRRHIESAIRLKTGIK